MNSFKTSYPALSALFTLIASAATQLAVQGQTLVQKIEGEFTLLPQVLTFIPQASNISAEIAAVKGSPAEIEAGIELLVTDFAFTSDKAKSVIAKSFAVGEWIIQGIEPVKELIAEIKA
jgi:hypothetical protein